MQCSDTWLDACLLEACLLNVVDCLLNVGDCFRLLLAGKVAMKSCEQASHKWCNFRRCLFIEVCWNGVCNCFLHVWWRLPDIIDVETLSSLSVLWLVCIFDCVEW